MVLGGNSGAILFFQLIIARHGRESTVLTSNKGFEDWGSVLGDEVMAAALIDRLLHHCHIVDIRGNSYRMPAHQDLLRTRHPDSDEDSRAWKFPVWQSPAQFLPGLGMAR